MRISEFKNSMNLIYKFVAKVNQEDVPHDIKKTLVKTYANTLSINLTDRMVDSITEVTSV